MAGAQVILALKSSKGAPEVKTYNIISYGDIREERLSFDVWDLSAETNATSGEFTIYASVKLPEKVESFNHIWQVGAAVNNGKPVKHEFAAENKDAKATLELTTAQKTGKSATTTTPAGGNSTGNGTTSSSNTTTNGGNSGSYRIKEMNVGFCFAVFVLLASFIVF
nr:unknown [Populus trichocarpa]